MRLHLETDEGKLIDLGIVNPRDSNAGIGAGVKLALREADKREGWWVLWKWSKDCLIEKIESASELPDDGNDGQNIAQIIQSWPDKKISEMRDSVLSSEMVCEQYHDDVVAILEEHKGEFDTLGHACKLAEQTAKGT